MTTLPDDLFERGAAPTFRPTARREIAFHEQPVELLWLPERRARQGLPGAGRPPFQADPAARIVREEAFWEGPDLAATGNPFPFAVRQVLLWSKRALREPDLDMLRATFAFTTRRGATALLNSVGAAASIARAHLHLIDERLGFLPALGTEPLDAPWCPVVDGVRVARVAAPFPVLVVVLHGDPIGRATALRRLLDVRTAPAFNAVDDGESTWVLPRSATEITAPFFPQALGAAELWGRWCFLDERPFTEATPEALDAALTTGGYPLRVSG